MDLNREILEFKESFKEGGFLTRVLLVLGFFFTVSSVTSLASTVIEWKGFIIAALNFYQFYFVNPVSSAASTVGLHYSNAEIHAATILSICVTVGMRLLAAGQKVAFREINAKYDSNLVPSMAFFWGVGIFSPVGIWVWYGISDAVVRPWLVIFVSVFYPVFFVLPKLIMSKFGWVMYERGHFSYGRAYYSYMVAIFLIIGALAAVNSGLRDAEFKKSMQPAILPVN